MKELLLYLKSCSQVSKLRNLVSRTGNIPERFSGAENVNILKLDSSPTSSGSLFLLLHPHYNFSHWKTYLFFFHFRLHFPSYRKEKALTYVKAMTALQIRLKKMLGTHFFQAN